MDDALTPVERDVKEYLVATLATDLAASLAQLAIERPADPYLWLARSLLSKSPQAPALLAALDAVPDHATGSQ